MARTMSSSVPFGAVGSGDRKRDMMPMAEMNTTPLIDVMLVLLIMFIITVPSQTHRISVNLPPPGPTIAVRPLSNDLRLAADGRLSWNGQAMSDEQLSGVLAGIAALPVPPEVHFRPDATVPYQRVDQVLAIAARSGASTFGFAGNEQYRDSF
jgi:biopolymer transport protein ExbD